ncbi:Microtubule-associated proteins 1A/1B light chain 3C [Blattella germanica]|nr:Microtubule-associated proteins 1A/1B light chain 3C [Blattella germanica]
MEEINRNERRSRDSNFNVRGTSSCFRSSSRKEEVAVIRSKFPNKVPVIVDRFYKELSLPQLDKTKFLVPQEITMSQFVTIIRNRMQLGSTQAFYLLVNNRSMVSLSKTLAEVYSEHQDDDGFLHVTYASQEVFGSSEARQ